MEMNTRMKKQIIFDMDGVLFDTENLVFSCWKFAAGKFMLTGIEDVFYQVIGVSSEGTKKVFSKTYGDKLDYAQFREETHRMFDEKIEKNVKKADLPCSPVSKDSPNCSRGCLPRLPREQRVRSAHGILPRLSREQEGAVCARGNLGRI